MRTKIPHLNEIGLGAAMTLAVALGYMGHSGLIETVSYKTYDLLCKRRTPPTKPQDAIHIIEIDDKSVAGLGRWPWPRALMGNLIDEIVGTDAKIIGLNVFFTEPDQNSGIEEIGRLEEKYKQLLDENRPALQKKKVDVEPFEAFATELSDSKNNLNGDAILGRSIQEAASVILPMYFQPGEALGNLDPLPAFFEKEKLDIAPEAPFPPANAATLPLEAFATAGIGVGHSNLTPDDDGSIRRVAPVFHYGQSAYPSFGLQLVREYLNLQRSAVTWKAESGLTLNRAEIPLDERAYAYLDFGATSSIPRHSAVDVLAGNLPEKSLQNKIVLVGITAPGLAPLFTVPTGLNVSGLDIWATQIDNILNQRFIVRPRWAGKAEWGMLALAALIVMFALPLLRARYAISIAAAALVGFVGTSAALFIGNGKWVSPAPGLVLLATGFIVLVGKRLMFTERGKELVEMESVETNKMLGLSFQGQGMLDLAFEKFSKCPVDDQLKNLLYNLALDMERKRMFSKAAAVYERIAMADPGYKDIKEKIELLKKAGEGAVFGQIGKKGSDSTVVVQGLGQYTTLGRYEIVKELGRGAMGIVYLGRDPKINRQVAIKTLRFEDNVDEEQAKSVKERFFREAESAGNLTHPNIIRIFDAGEDQEVAYIAMELIEGEDLKRFCEKANLLPREKVLTMIAQVAGGLEYAHRQGVVHRDIKPGNIMLLRDGSLRITDFGIARIQANSKTATGAVLGTPAYMSPEQVNGKKVDGRADIFSLGVTLYEMLTGEKPFHADTIAALLYRIANVEHPDPREFAADLPKSVIAALNKALAKDPEARYQSAGEFANDLFNCAAEIKGEPATRPAPSGPMVVERNIDNVSPAQPVIPMPAENAVAAPSETASKPVADNTTAPAAATMDEATANRVNAEAALNQLMGFLSGAKKSADAAPAPTEAAAEQTKALESTVVMPTPPADTPPTNPVFEHNYQPPTPPSDEPKA